MTHPHVESFGSAEEMFAAMTEREAAANEGLLPNQIALRDDVEHTRVWLRLLPDGAGVLPIFGWSWSLREASGRERSYYEPKTDNPDVAIADEFGAAEFASIVEGLRERRTRGYLYGECFSVVEPDGELGDTHVSSVWPLTEEAFAEAKAHGWDVRACPRDGLVWKVVDEIIAQAIEEQG